MSISQKIKPEVPLRLIVDHDKTPVRVGKQRRQSTLIAFDELNAIHNQDIAKPELIFDPSDRFTSLFPEDVSLRSLETVGYPMRALFPSVGLQFVDLYLGLWRQLNASACPFDIHLLELGLADITGMHWI